jgi:hypothetical protein
VSKASLAKLNWPCPEFVGYQKVSMCDMGCFSFVVSFDPKLQKSLDK